MANCSSSTNELLGKERPWEGHCVLRVPNDYDTAPLDDPASEIEFFHENEGDARIVINGATHPLRIVPLPKPLDVSVSRDRRAFFKAADIVHMALLGDAKEPEKPETETKKWSLEDHEDAIEMANRLIRRRPMVFVEESEVDEAVYIQRLKDNPESIWTADKPNKGVLITTQNDPKMDE